MFYAMFLLITFLVLAFSFYHFQYHMMFTPKYYRSSELDDRFEILNITTNDGTSLEGVVYEDKDPKATILFFPGRSYDAVGLIEKMSCAYDDIRIVTFNYRSYGKSEGKVDEKNIFTDALYVTQKIKEKYGDIYVAGFSLGSSVASFVTSKEVVKGVFLIGIYDSIAGLTKIKYGINLSLISRYKFDNKVFVSDIDSDTYIFVSKADEVTYIQSARELKKYVKNLVFYHEFERLTHNDLLCNKDIINKIKEIVY